MPDHPMGKSELMGLLTIYFKSFFVWLSRIMEYIVERIPDRPPEEVLQMFGDGEAIRAEFIDAVSRTISERMDLEHDDIPLFTFREELAFVCECLIPIVIRDIPSDARANVYGNVSLLRFIASIPDYVPSISLMGLLHTQTPTRRELIALEKIVSDVAADFSISATDVFVLQHARDEVTRRRMDRQGYMDMFSEVIKMIFPKPSEMRVRFVDIQLASMRAKLDDADARAQAQQRVDEKMPRLLENMKAARDAVIAFLSEERKRIYGS